MEAISYDLQMIQCAVLSVHSGIAHTKKARLWRAYMFL